MSVQATRKPRKMLPKPAGSPTRVLLPSDEHRLPEGNVQRFRNRLRGLRDRWRAGRVTYENVHQRVGSWIAHAEHANTWRLRQAVFRDGWFEPSRGPDRPPAGGCFAAVPGTTNLRTSGPRTATGTPPGTETTTGSALPVRSVVGAGSSRGRRAHARASKDGHDGQRPCASLALLR